VWRDERWGYNLGMTSFAAVLAAVLLASVASARSTPSVAFASLTPTVVHGAGFSPGSTVRVTVSWRGGVVAKAVHVDARGQFSARWTRSVRAELCKGLVATAVMPSGRRVSVRPPGALTLCHAVPPPTPPKT